MGNSTPTVTLGGVLLSGARTISWNQTPGSSPYMTVIECDAARGGELIGRAGEAMTLSIRDEGSTRSVNQVYVLREVASSRPELRAFLISDLRWKWARAHILGRYNIRRRTGEKRLVEEGLPIQIASTVPTYLYAAWSLRDGSEKWDAMSVLEDVFKKLADESGFALSIGKISDGRSVPIENLEIDDAGDSAVGIALSYASGYDVFVDDYGTVHVYDVLDGSEQAALAVGTPQVGSEIPRFVSYAAVRPRKVRVWFTPEIEVRFDYHRLSSIATTVTAGESSREMSNVASVTDSTIEVGGGTAAAGSWETMDSLIAAWNAAPNPRSENVPTPQVAISDEVIRKNWMVPGLWRMFTPLGDSQSNSVWQGRIGSVRAHYRQTFRLPRNWMDRVYSISATRVGITDVTTGQRATSTAWANYCWKPSIRGFFTDVRKNLLGENVDGYPGSDTTPLSSGKVCPASVSLTDDQAGIVHLNFRVDPYGLSAEMIPSKVDNIPTLDYSDPSVPPTWESRSKRTGALPTLSETHGVALVLTAVPAAPNGLGQLYYVDVSPGEAASSLGSKIGACNGPVWNVRVGAGEVTAMFAWSDEGGVPDAIEQAFGFHVAENQKDFDENKATLKAQLVNSDVIEAIALAKAAEVYSALVDRSSGSKTFRLDPSVEIAGKLSSVGVTVGTDGVVTSTVSAREEIEPVNAFALLPPAVRRVVFREVVPR